MKRGSDEPDTPHKRQRVSETHHAVKAGGKNQSSERTPQQKMFERHFQSLMFDGPTVDLSTICDDCVQMIVNAMRSPNETGRDIMRILRVCSLSKRMRTFLPNALGFTRAQFSRYRDQATAVHVCCPITTPAGKRRSYWTHLVDMSKFCADYNCYEILTLIVIHWDHCMNHVRCHDYGALAACVLRSIKSPPEPPTFQLLVGCLGRCVARWGRGFLSNTDCSTLVNRTLMRKSGCTLGRVIALDQVIPHNGQARWVRTACDISWRTLVKRHQRDVVKYVVGTGLTVDELACLTYMVMSEAGYDQTGFSRWYCGLEAVLANATANTDALNRLLAEDWQPMHRHGIKLLAAHTPLINERISDLDVYNQLLVRE